MVSDANQCLTAEEPYHDPPTSFHWYRFAPLSEGSFIGSRLNNPSRKVNKPLKFGTR